MFVAEILKTKGNAVFSIAPERTVADACAALEERRVGALVVCDGDRVAGVFSERDVVRALAADGAAALNRPVADYMTAKGDLRRTQGRDVGPDEPDDRPAHPASAGAGGRTPGGRHLHRRRGEVSDRGTRPGGRQPAVLYRRLKRLRLPACDGLTTVVLPVFSRIPTILLAAKKGCPYRAASLGNGPACGALGTVFPGFSRGRKS